MKRKKSELDFVKSFIDSTYNSFGHKLLVDDNKKYNPLDPNSALGFCFKYDDPTTKTTIYKIECSKTGLSETDFRVKMHEYGHIYLGHLDGIYEDLDARVYITLEEHREELIEEINQRCGIDFADKLLNRIMDDPYLNHSLHNIAMDMEVNSSILSIEDIDEMEKDLTSLIPNYEVEFLKQLGEKVDEERKKVLDDIIKKAEAETKVKLVHPFRYHLGIDDSGNPIPFPDNLSYPQYLILIILNLDQFVKMLVSIKMGGNGDTSGITQQDIQDALNNILDQLQGKSEAYKQGYRDAVNDLKNHENQQQGSGEGKEKDPQNQQGQGSGTDTSSMSESEKNDYDQGYQDAINDMMNSQSGGGGMQGLSDLMQGAGMAPPQNNQQDGDGSQPGSGSESGPRGQEGKGNPQDSSGGNGNGPKYSGMRDDPNAIKYGKDHASDSRKKADEARSDGSIRTKASLGCGNSGGGDGTRTISKEVDEVDMALQEVMSNMKNRVIKYSSLKDNMRNYNRGIIRSVIAPTITRKVTVCNEPKIVFLIDISGSMNTSLIDRCLSTISNSLKKMSRGLKYDIITWNTGLGEHIKDIDPRHPITTVSYGGGTSIAKGIKYFKDNYGPEAILVIISDFEDYLEEWSAVEETMTQYSLYGFNYGCDRSADNIEWKNLKVRKFKTYD